ncbi:MAG: SDR family NAD(P)-dependent oxidoreductase [Promethearchaeota archaeon]
MENKFLEGKTALITGAASGFGRAMAIQFAKKGADLLLNDINIKGLEETKQLVLKEASRKIVLHEADISDSAQMKLMAKRAFKEFDNIFIIVNNAGISGTLSTSLKTKEEVYDRVMNVNVKGAWNVTRAFFRSMKRQKQFLPIVGKIINIASVAGTPNGINPYLGIYSASKAALIALTKLWALELGADNITVNAISPGLFVTPIYKDDPELINKMKEMRGVKLPIDRLGEAKEVADIALFLASPVADYITGQNIVIDGGMSISVNKL